MLKYILAAKIYKTAKATKQQSSKFGRSRTAQVNDI